LYPPLFLLSAIAFCSYCWEVATTSDGGDQQVAMTIEYPGNQNHMKSPSIDSAVVLGLCISVWEETAE